MLGPKIREIRTEKGLTLAKLSELTNLTIGYISQVERSMIDPSLSSLRKISKALETPIYNFLSEGTEEYVCIKADDRRMLKLPNSYITYEFISPMGSDFTYYPRMEIIYFELQPQKWSSEKALIHAAEECVFVISGRIEACLSEDKYILGKGDSVYIKENIPHRFYNPSDEVAIGLSCVSPPVY